MKNLTIERLLKDIQETDKNIDELFAKTLLEYSPTLDELIYDLSLDYYGFYIKKKKKWRSP